MNTYEEARRAARKLLGAKADVEHKVGQPFPFRVGVQLDRHFVYVGLGNSYTEALKDAESRQKR